MLGGEKNTAQLVLIRHIRFHGFFFLISKVRSLLIDHSDNWWQGTARSRELVYRTKRNDRTRRAKTAHQQPGAFTDSRTAGMSARRKGRWVPHVLYRRGRVLARRRACAGVWLAGREGATHARVNHMKLRTCVLYKTSRFYFSEQMFSSTSHSLTCRLGWTHRLKYSSIWEHQRYPPPPVPGAPMGRYLRNSEKCRPKCVAKTSRVNYFWLVMFPFTFDVQYSTSWELNICSKPMRPKRTHHMFDSTPCTLGALYARVLFSYLFSLLPAVFVCYVLCWVRNTRLSNCGIFCPPRPFTAAWRFAHA